MGLRLFCTERRLLWLARPPQSGSARTGVRASQDNRHSVPTHIPIPGPTLPMAGRGGGSNTTHALPSPDPETLPIGEVSRPATGEFL